MTTPTAPSGLSLADAFNLAARLFNEGQLAEAEHVAARILEHAPDHPDTLHLLGLLRRFGNDLAGAAVLFEKALRHRRTPSFLSNYGSVLMMLGRHDEAVAAMSAAAEMDGTDAGLFFNLGVTLRSGGRMEAALVAFARAGAIDPTHAPSHNLRGLILLDLGRFEAAAAVLRAALVADPAHAGALTALGYVLSRLNRHMEALPHHRRAVAVEPARLESAVHAVDVGRFCLCFDTQDALQADLVRALDLVLARDPGAADWKLLSSVLYRDLYRPLPAPARVATERVFAQRLAVAAGPAPAAFAAPAARPARLRVGYLSVHLKNHPIGQVTLSLFAAHDRARFEIHGFTRVAGVPEGDSYAVRHRAGFDRVHDIAGLSGPAIADSIRAAGIDILVYLDGHMDKDGLVAMACRPAPVRVYWMGHAGGLGTVVTDYLLADRVVVPFGEEGRYAEAVVRLPVSYHPADCHPINPVGLRRDYGLPDEGIVFCAFNNTEKVDGPAFAHWMEILRRVEGSVLWLSRSGALDEPVRNLSRFAAQAGVDPARILLADRVADKADHYARHQAADLFLDTWTMNASTTALDALWAGLPLVTLAGNCFSNRIAASMLTALGLEEMICPTPRAYVALAEALAVNPQALAALRARLWAARATSPLFDMPRFAARMEAAYERMWERWRQGGPPQGFTVPEVTAP